MAANGSATIPSCQKLFAFQPGPFYAKEWNPGVDLEGNPTKTGEETTKKNTGGLLTTHMQRSESKYPLP